MKIKNGVWLICISSLILISILAWGCTTEQPKASGGIVRILEMNQGAGFGYPPKALAKWGAKQALPAVETLFRNDVSGKPAPWLATGYTNDAKAKTTVITLQKGVKFHDNTAFDAAAVKWNMEQYKAAKSAGTENIASIDVIDDYTVRINYTKWDNTLIGNMTYMTGMMISPAAFKANGQQWCETHPVGTGPFKFVSYQPDVSTTYEKFDGYWQKGKPRVDGIKLNVISDMTTREMAFRAGEGDAVLTLQPNQVLALQKDGYPSTKNSGGLSGTVTIVFDSANPQSPFANVKVRQAVYYAINTKTIADTIYIGMAVPTNQWSYKEHWSYNPDVKGYPYNPEKAKQLLAEAGYPNGIKTKLTYATDPNFDKVFQVVQSDLKKIGIDAALELIAPPKWGQLALQGGSWEGLLYNAAASNPSYTAALAQRFGKGNTLIKMDRPDEFLQGIEKAMAAADFKEEQKVIQEVMKLMIDKYCMVVPMPVGEGYAITQKYLQNHGILTTASGIWWTPEDVWINK